MNEAYATLLAQLAAGVKFLPDKPEETPDSTLRALWLAASGARVSAEMAIQGEVPALSPQQLVTLGEMVERRITGVPLAHITGRQRFMGIEMLAGPGALVPRKETEILGSAAVRLARQAAERTAEPLIIDVCTGSGNVALAVAHHVKTACVWGADLSAEAVELARRNADHLGLASRVTFSVGDLLEPFDSERFIGRVDLLTCNPPYITSMRVNEMPHEISAYEPRLAFDGGTLGVRIVMKLLNEAGRFLKPGGWLAFEVGLGQGPALVKRLMGARAFKEVLSEKDASGSVRVIMARC